MVCEKVFGYMIRMTENILRQPMKPVAFKKQTYATTKKDNTTYCE